MNSPLVYLLGWPGVGKLSVARTMARRTGWRVVDNHLINDPIFHVVGADGVTPLPDGTRPLVRRVRAAVFEAMTSVAPAHLGYIMTNMLVESENDRLIFSQVEEIARHRNAVFLPVLLTCEEHELRRRIITPERAERLKARSVEVLDHYLTQHTLLVPDHPDLLTLDTTHLSAEQAAHGVLAHLTASAADSAPTRPVEPSAPAG
ncbi:AAA family ATPase [Deinococcus peraridilitoris]|nr:AAA family ATPase [Deinococcus peraridilitoris]